jgi:hypothetical protein
MEIFFLRITWRITYIFLIEFLHTILGPEVRGLNFGPKKLKKICAIYTQFDTEVFF